MGEREEIENIRIQLEEILNESLLKNVEYSSLIDETGKKQGGGEKIEKSRIRLAEIMKIILRFKELFLEL